METVFILHHSYELEECEETKLIGAYSTREQAELAINRLKYKNGFKYRPDAFVISEYELDQDNWTEGFATMTTIQVKSKDDTWITVQAECLPNNSYQIWEPYDNDSLGAFKHLDIVKCEERDKVFFAVRLISRADK